MGINVEENEKSQQVVEKERSFDYRPFPSDFTFNELLDAYYNSSNKKRSREALYSWAKDVFRRLPGGENNPISMRYHSGYTAPMITPWEVQLLMQTILEVADENKKLTDKDLEKAVLVRYTEHLNAFYLDNTTAQMTTAQTNHDRQSDNNFDFIAFQSYKEPIIDKTMREEMKPLIKERIDNIFNKLFDEVHYLPPEYFYQLIGKLQEIEYNLTNWNQDYALAVESDIYSLFNNLLSVRNSVIGKPLKSINDYHFEQQDQIDSNMQGLIEGMLNEIKKRPKVPDEDTKKTFKEKYAKYLQYRAQIAFQNRMPNGDITTEFQGYVYYWKKIRNNLTSITSRKEYEEIVECELYKFICSQFHGLQNMMILTVDPADTKTIGEAFDISYCNALMTNIHTNITAKLYWPFYAIMQANFIFHFVRATPPFLNERNSGMGIDSSLPDNKLANKVEEELRAELSKFDSELYGNTSADISRFNERYMAQSAVAEFIWAEELPNLETLQRQYLATRQQCSSLLNLMNLANLLEWECRCLGAREVMNGKKTMMDAYDCLYPDRTDASEE